MTLGALEASAGALLASAMGVTLAPILVAPSKMAPFFTIIAGVSMLPKTRAVDCSSTMFLALMFPCTRRGPDRADVDLGRDLGRLTMSDRRGPIRR